jgi:hypothetical protein
MWKDTNCILNSKSYRQKLSDRSSKMMIERIQKKGSIYSRSKNGWYEISGEKYYFRSSWEVVYARYLEWLKHNKKIDDWTYEEDTFWFENIKRGVRSYTPDFKLYITNENGMSRIEYHEVKGYMDSKSKTKIKRLKKYYPNINFELIDKHVYKDINAMERLYPDAKLINNK